MEDRPKQGESAQEYRNLLINSTLAFVFAHIITTVFHESGHYLAFVVFVANPTLFHNFVQTSQQAMSIPAQIVISLAGPLFALLQGLFFSALVARRRKNTMRSLIFLWLGLLGLVNALGYLMLTPLMTMGDTGYVAELLKLDYSIRIAIGVVGFGLLLWIVIKTGTLFSIFIPTDCAIKTRAAYVYRLLFFPVVFGSMASTLLAFPVRSWLDIIYPATSSFVIPIAFGFILKSPVPQTTQPAFGEKVDQALLILTLAAILLNRLLSLGVG